MTQPQISNPYSGMQERIISLKLANILSLFVAIGCTVAALVLYYLVWGNIPDIGFTALGGAFILYLLAGILLHELIHGLFWGIFAPGHFRDISFGVIWKALAPYCHCHSPLRRNAYLIGALAPLLLAGLLPCAVGIAIQSLALTIAAAILTAGAIGDILVALKAIKERPDALLLDHPSKAGYLVKNA